MDDSCAVCADALEWVAYGTCGHRDVCSTCVARLRVICNDRRCCICKSECPIVFVTKALGDYTRTISDFSVFSSEPREGRVGSYWYNEDTEAFFDDSDHYKMIKAMCRLSCSVCDKMEEETNNGPKRRARFKNIEQLKGHLFHRHRLIMCSLCLEGRKVFICEQKLYTRAQLNRHISTGDSEVDGDESERAGFTGHPLCEFCKSPFYGDNELYLHMSTEHYTCHICQRQHPGQYEYYRNYNDLEIHFRREHFLCEDEACLAKKFVVFQSEAEMKRHNTLEHGGRMSRAKRNAALQIPTSFRYSRNDQDHRRGRGRTFHHDQSDDLLLIAIQASLEMAHSEGTSRDQPSSSMHVLPDLGDTDIDSIVQPIETLAVTDSEASSRYLQALGHSRNAPLQESLFPPLPLPPSGSQQKGKHESKTLPSNTVASHLRQQNTRIATAPNSGQAWPAAGRSNVSSHSTQWPVVNVSSAMPRSSTENSLAAQSSSSQGSTQWPAINPSSAMSKGSAGNSFIAQSSSSQAINSTVWPAINPSSAMSRGSVGNSLTAQSSSSQARNRPLVNHGHPSGSSGSSGKISHSVSAPNLSQSGSSAPFISDFPPVSAARIRKDNPASQILPPVEDVHAANKSLVEKMRDALQNDEEKLAMFKVISGQYRQGSMVAGEYLYHVQQFRLSHLIMDLARLCPDPQKQRELIEAYNASLRGSHQNNGSSIMKDNNKSRKGKGVAAKNRVSNETLTDKILSTVPTLQLNHNPVEEVEVLSKDGYRSARGKSTAGIHEQALEKNGQNDSSSLSNGFKQNIKDGGGGSKQKKKSRFHRIRLGDGSAAAYLDLRNSDPDPDPEPDPLENRVDKDSNQNGGLPVKGVWRKGGSSKLFP